MVEAHSKIISFASYIPENYVPIDDFAAPADMPSKLDLNRITGLEGHRRSKENEGTLELALQAATKCIERSKVDIADIDLVINCAVGSLCSELRSKLSPSLANLIAEKLGIEGAECFDVSNACSGMVTSLMIADSMIKTGQINYALIVAGEHITALVDEARTNNLWFKSKALASLTLGDGSGAYLIGKSELPNQLVFSEPFTLARFNKLCVGEASKNRPGPMMRTKAAQLQQGVMSNLGEFFIRSMKYMDLDWEAIDHVYSHPTSPRAVKKGAGIAENTVGKIKRLHNESQDIANTASTSHCMLLEKSVQLNQLKSGESVILVSFGSGVAMLAMHFYLPEGIEQWS